jgi:DME family drug/metabolite transporter
MRPRLLIVFAALCFSTTGTMQELGPENANALSIAAARTAIGAIALLLISRLGHTESARGWLPLRELALAGAGMALYAVAFFSAVRMTGIAVGTVVALGSAPLFAGLGSLVIWRDRPSVRWALTTIVAVLGMALIVATGDETQIDVAGIAAACAAGIGYALFALSSKSIMSESTNAAGAMALVFGIATVLLSPIFFFIDLSWITSWSGVGTAAWLGIVSVALAYWAYSTGLRSVTPADATALTIVEPVAATLLAAFVLREQPGLLAWVGIAIVIGALSIGSRRPS